MLIRVISLSGARCGKLEDLAPIAISTYGRAKHLRLTVEALQRNPLAAASELYFFSDAPKPGDESKVREVREFIRTVDGFKAVHIVERTENSRIANNRGGIEMLLDRYGKVIFLEEDVVTAPGFLEFMNAALSFYEHDERIGSVSGYCPPMAFPSDYVKDVFFLTRLNPWGVGLWKRYYKMNTYITEERFAEVFDNARKLKALANGVGEEALRFIKMDFERKLDAGDMKSIFWQFYDKKLTVYPRKSLVRSIGQDGSGFHMDAVEKWDVRELWDKVQAFELSREVGVNEKIRKSHYEFYKVHAITKMISFLQRIGVYKYMQPIVRYTKEKLGGKWGQN